MAATRLRASRRPRARTVTPGSRKQRGSRLAHGGAPPTWARSPARSQWRCRHERCPVHRRDADDRERAVRQRVGVTTALTTGQTERTRIGNIACTLQGHAALATGLDPDTMGHVIHRRTAQRAVEDAPPRSTPSQPRCSPAAQDKPQRRHPRQRRRSIAGSRQRVGPVRGQPHHRRVACRCGSAPHDRPRPAVPHAMRLDPGQVCSSSRRALMAILA